MSSIGDLLWTPSAQRIAQANMTAFSRAVAAQTGQEFVSYADLHRWSVEHPEAFWSAIWSSDRRPGAGGAGCRRFDAGCAVVSHGAT